MTDNNQTQLRHDAKDVLRVERALQEARRACADNLEPLYSEPACQLVRPSDYDAALRLVTYAVAKLVQEHTDG